MENLKGKFIVFNPGNDDMFIHDTLKSAEDGTSGSDRIIRLDSYTEYIKIGWKPVEAPDGE